MSFFRSPNVKVVRIRTSYSKLRHSGNRRNHGTVLNKSLLPKSAFAIFRHSVESRSPYLPLRLDTGLRHSGMTDGAKDNCDTAWKRSNLGCFVSKRRDCFVDKAPRNDTLSNIGYFVKTTFVLTVSRLDLNTMM